MQAPPLRHEAVAHIFENATQGTAIGIGHGHVGNDPFAKEAEGALVGAVDELIRHHHVEGAVLLLQGAHGRNRQNPAHIEGAQGPDVGPVGHLGWGESVVAAVASQKHHFQIADATDAQAVGGPAIGCIQVQLPHVVEAIHGIEATASKDTEAGGGEFSAGTAGHEVGKESAAYLLQGALGWEGEPSSRRKQPCGSRWDGPKVYSHLSLPTQQGEAPALLELRGSGAYSTDLGAATSSPRGSAGSLLRKPFFTSPRQGSAHGLAVLVPPFPAP